jgi:hypothetical protein
MASNPVCWFEIYVQDMARARAFYETVLQVKLGLLNPAGPELWAFPQDVATPGSGGALARTEGVSSGGNSTVVYFRCVDCAVEASRVVAAGGKIMKEPFSIGQYGTIALAFDTEGNLFGLHATP